MSIPLEEKHIFSLYAPEDFPASWKVGSIVLLHDVGLVHRLTKVIKISVGGEFIIFNHARHMHLAVESFDKKTLRARVISLLQNAIKQQNVICFLPLLKREALEEAVYSLCEIGIFAIQLIVTHKSRQHLLSFDKDLQRLQNIIIAAAEQSKNYSFPCIKSPMKLLDAMQTIGQNCSRLTFDSTGKPFFDSAVHKMRLRGLLTDQADIVVLIGPEGGLLNSELDVLKNHNFEICRLTATTLRAVQAVSLGAALVNLS